MIFFVNASTVLHFLFHFKHLFTANPLPYDFIGKDLLSVISSPFMYILEGMRPISTTII